MQMLQSNVNPENFRSENVTIELFFLRSNFTKLDIRFT